MKLRALLQTSLHWSRRQADTFICEQGVSVDGIKIFIPGLDVDPARQVIRVNQKKIKPAGEHVYIIFHKPINLICSHRRQGSTRTIFHLLPDNFRVLRFAGRLDKNSRGLVILSTDGHFLQYLSRPEYGFRRLYLVTVKGNLDINRLKQYSRNGWQDDSDRFQPFSYRIISQTHHLTQLEIVLTEGKKREIRRLVQKLGARVSDLLKTEHGPVKLGQLPETSWEHIPKNIITSIFKIDSRKGLNKKG